MCIKGCKEIQSRTKNSKNIEHTLAYSEQLREFLIFHPSCDRETSDTFPEATTTKDNGLVSVNMLLYVHIKSYIFSVAVVKDSGEHLFACWMLTPSVGWHSSEST